MIAVLLSDDRHRDLFIYTGAMAVAIHVVSAILSARAQSLTRRLTGHWLHTPLSVRQNALRAERPPPTRPRWRSQHQRGFFVPAVRSIGWLRPPPSGATRTRSGGTVDRPRSCCGRTASTAALPVRNKRCRGGAFRLHVVGPQHRPRCCEDPLPRTQAVSYTDRGCTASMPAITIRTPLLGSAEAPPPAGLADPLERVELDVSIHHVRRTQPATPIASERRRRSTAFGRRCVPPAPAQTWQLVRLQATQLDHHGCHCAGSGPASSHSTRSCTLLVAVSSPRLAGSTWFSRA